jgi:hypothetical protein
VFIGHFALGFAAKRSAPRLSLAVLFAAAQFADLLWPFLIALGIEQVRIDPGNTAFTPLDFVSYPYSHSLLFLCVWGTLFGAICATVVRRAAAGVVVAALVVSHWVLDFATHVPDIPVGLSGPFVGLGLWRSLPATIAVEGTLFAAGLTLYVRATAARDRIGSAGLAALAVFLVVMYFASLAAPPPPNVRAVAWGTLATVFFPVWGYWVDRHREPRMPRTD